MPAAITAATGCCCVPRDNTRRCTACATLTDQQHHAGEQAQRTGGAALCQKPVPACVEQHSSTRGVALNHHTGRGSACSGRITPAEAAKHGCWSHRDASPCPARHHEVTSTTSRPVSVCVEGPTTQQQQQQRGAVGTGACASTAGCGGVSSRLQGHPCAVPPSVSPVLRVPLKRARCAHVERLVACASSDGGSAALASAIIGCHAACVRGLRAA